MCRRKAGYHPSTLFRPPKVRRLKAQRTITRQRTLSIACVLCWATPRRISSKHLKRRSSVERRAKIDHLADVFSDHFRLGNDAETVGLHSSLLKLFEYSIKLKVNRQRSIDPKSSSIGSMLERWNALLKTEIEEQGRDQALLALME